MQRASLSRKIVTMLLFLSLALCQVAPAFAQEGDGIVPDNPASAAADTSQAEVDKGEFTPGESSSVEARNSYLYLPFAAGGDKLQAAAPNAAWVTVLYDELCSYPTGWTRYDYNGTGHAWTYATVDSLCTIRPSGVVNKENVTTYRTVSVAGGTDARALVRFKMATEQYFDFFRIEFSCGTQPGRTFYGWPSAYSGSYGWSTAVVSLGACAGSSTLRFRLTFQSDATVLTTMAPIIDYVRIQKWQ